MTSWIKRIALFYLFALPVHGYGQATYARTLLWEISGKDMQQPSYLYGTFHINHDEVYDLNDSVLAKLVACDAFANEFNADSISSVLEHIDLNEKKNEKKVKDLLSPEEIKRLDTYLRKRKKVNLKDLENNTAEEVYMAISGFGTASGEKNTMLDGWLYNLARNYNKQIFGLENAEDTYSMVKQIPEKEQRDLLISIVDSGSVLRKLEEDMLAAYVAEDLDAIQALVTSNESEFVKDLLLIDRNRTMLASMKRIMATQSCFFAVGTAHLPGKDGLIQLLRTEGYSVQPVMAPKTGYYKKFVVEDKPIAWEKFTDLQSGYSVNMPGKPAAMNYQGLKMNGYYDLGTGQIFLTLGFPIPPGANDEEIFKMMEKSYSTEGKVKNRHAVTYNNLKGVDMDILKPEMEMRMRLLRRGTMLYLFAAGAQPYAGSTINPNEQFFNSVEFFDAVQEYNEFTSDSGAFSMNVPASFRMTDSVNESNQHRRTWSGTDNSKGITLSVICADYGYGRYFNNLETLYDAVTESFIARIDPNGFRKCDTLISGYAARKFVLDAASCGYGEILWVMRESRLYLVIALCESREQKEEAHALAGTFHFSPYLPGIFLPYTSPQKDFTVLMAPLQSTKKMSEEQSEETVDTTTHYNYSIDLASGSTYSVVAEEFGKYYHTSLSDSAYFANLFTSMFNEDSVLSMQVTRKGTALCAKATIEFTKNKSYRANYLLVLNGRKLYTVCCYQAPTAQGDSITNLFLGSFKLLETGGPDIFTSTLDALARALSASDTSQEAELSDALEAYDVAESEMAVLKGCLKYTYPDDTLQTENTKYKLYDKLFDLLPDSMARARYVLQHYEEMGTNPHLRVLALTQLTKTDNDTCFLQLKKWLLRDRPVPSTNYTLYRLFSSRQPQARLLYPDILDLGSDSAYRAPLYYNTNALLEEKILQPSDIASVRPALQADVLSAYDTLARGPETEIPSALENKMRILNRFDGDTILALNRTIISRGYFGQYAFAVRYLASHNQRPDEKMVLKCLEKPEYRWAVYEAFEQSGKAQWYPEKYREQKYFAEDDLHNYLLYGQESEPDQMKYFGTFPVKIANADKLLYVFKVYYQDTTGKSVPYLAWSGPFSTDVKILEGDGEWTGTSFDAWEEKTYKEKLRELEAEMNNPDEEED